MTHHPTHYRDLTGPGLGTFHWSGPSLQTSPLSHSPGLCPLIEPSRPTLTPRRPQESSPPDGVVWCTVVATRRDDRCSPSGSPVAPPTPPSSELLRTSVECGNNTGHFGETWTSTLLQVKTTTSTDETPLNNVDFEHVEPSPHQTQRAQHTGGKDDLGPVTRLHDLRDPPRHTPGEFRRADTPGYRRGGDSRPGGRRRPQPAPHPPHLCYPVLGPHPSFEDTPTRYAHDKGLLIDQFTLRQDV